MKMVVMPVELAKKLQVWSSKMRHTLDRESCIMHQEVFQALLTDDELSYLSTQTHLISVYSYGELEKLMATEAWSVKGEG